jgi:hypothetical protein
MALSQFNPKLTVAPAAAGKSDRQRRIQVGGPLVIAARDDYDEHRIRVQFQIAQVPRGGRTEEDKSTNQDVVRVHGMGREVAGGKRWRGTVELGDLKIGTADKIKKETRGVAIAVLERKGQFAFDTITWCDEIELVNTKPPG